MGGQLRPGQRRQRHRGDRVGGDVQPDVLSVGRNGRRRQAQPVQVDIQQLAERLPGRLHERAPVDLAEHVTERLLRVLLGEPLVTGLVTPAEHLTAGTGVGWSVELDAIVQDAGLGSALDDAALAWGPTRRIAAGRRRRGRPGSRPRRSAGLRGRRGSARRISGRARTAVLRPAPARCSCPQSSIPAARADGWLAFRTTRVSLFSGTAWSLRKPLSASGCFCRC